MWPWLKLSKTNPSLVDCELSKLFSGVTEDFVVRSVVLVGSGSNGYRRAYTEDR